MHKTHVIAVVDDDEAMRTSLSSLLRASGYQVFCYAAPADYLDSDGPAQTDCLISDIQMPGMGGLQMLDALRAQGWRMPVIFVSAHAGKMPNSVPGVIACLAKPFQAERLLACLEKALG